MASSTSRKVRLLKNGMLDARPTNASASISMRNSEQSPLLRLPAELRNRIYAHWFECKQIVRIESEGVFPFSIYKTDGGDFGMWFGLTRCQLPRFAHIQCLCRAIYTETVLLPFTLNEFAFSIRFLNEYTPGILTAQLEAILSVFFLIYMKSISQWPGSLHVIRSFGGLRKVILCCSKAFEWETRKTVLEERIKLYTSAKIETYWAMGITVEDCRIPSMLT